MVFSAIEARFRRILMRIIAILPGFSIFFRTILGQSCDFQARESSKGNESWLKLDIINPKMHTSTPMRWAIIQIPSIAIDGPSMTIGKSCDGHRWAAMGLN